MVNIVSNIFIFFILAKKLPESWLIRRNMRFILANRYKVPDKLSKDLSEEDHLKASSYSLAKIKTSRVFSFMDILILLSWTFLGGLESFGFHGEESCRRRDIDGSSFSCLYGFYFTRFEYSPLPLFDFFIRGALRDEQDDGQAFLDGSY